MRDHDDGHPFFLVEALEQLHHFHAGLGIQRARGLVGQDDLRARDKGAGDGDTLLLAAGHLVGKVRSPGREPQLVQVLHGQLVALLPRNSLIIKGKLHVLHGCLEVDQVKALEHEADHPVAVVRRRLFAQVPDEFPVQPVFAGIVTVQDAQDVEEGGLPGTGRAHDGDELTPFDGEVDALEHVQGLSVVVRLVDVLEFDQHFVCISMLLHCKYRMFFRNGQIFLQIFGREEDFVQGVISDSISCT